MIVTVVACLGLAAIGAAAVLHRVANAGDTRSRRRVTYLTQAIMLALSGAVCWFTAAVLRVVGFSQVHGWVMWLAVALDLGACASCLYAARGIYRLRRVTLMFQDHEHHRARLAQLRYMAKDIPSLVDDETPVG